MISDNYSALPLEVAPTTVNKGRWGSVVAMAELPVYFHNLHKSLLRIPWLRSHDHSNDNSVRCFFDQVIAPTGLYNRAGINGYLLINNDNKENDKKKGQLT